MYWIGIILSKFDRFSNSRIQYKNNLMENNFNGKHIHQWNLFLCWIFLNRKRYANFKKSIYSSKRNRWLRTYAWSSTQINATEKLSKLPNRYNFTATPAPNFYHKAHRLYALTFQYERVDGTINPQFIDPWKYTPHSRACALSFGWFTEGDKQGRTSFINSVYILNFLLYRRHSGIGSSVSSTLFYHSPCLTLACLCI